MMNSSHYSNINKSQSHNYYGMGQGGPVSVVGQGSNSLTSVNAPEVGKNLLNINKHSTLPPEPTSSRSVMQP